MDIACGVWVMASFVATLMCAVWRRRSAFGNMMLLGVAYFIALNFARETKKTPTLLMAAVPFAIVFLLVCLRAAVKFARKADVELWFGAGMQGAYMLWQKVRVDGAAARTYWLLQALCAGSIGLSISAQIALLVNKPTPEPEKHPDLGRTVRVRDDGSYLSSLNNDTSLDWPSEEMRKAAGENAWDGWKPKKGDRGTIIAVLKNPAGTGYYVVEFKDDKGTVRFAPFKEFDVELLNH